MPADMALKLRYDVHHRRVAASGRRGVRCGLQDQIGDLPRFLVEREVAGVRDGDEAYRRTVLESAPFRFGEPDVVVLPKDDPSRDTRLAKPGDQGTVPV